MTNKPTPEIDILIHVTAKKHKIPYTLLSAQVQQESAFNPLAVSHCGARGLMQIMPLTWRDITGQDADANNDIFDPEKNLAAGAKYLRRMRRAVTLFMTTLPTYAKHLAVCTEDDYWKFALASYNGGLGYVINAFNLCIGDNNVITWQTVRDLLDDVRLKTKSGRVLDPDDKQMIDYVEKIWTHYKGGSHE